MGESSKWGKPLGEEWDGGAGKAWVRPPPCVRPDDAALLPSGLPLVVQIGPLLCKRVFRGGGNPPVGLNCV